MSRHAQGSQPADFDQAACPIIARHYFGCEPFILIGAAIVPVIQRIARSREASSKSGSRYQAQVPATAACLRSTA